MLLVNTIIPNKLTNRGGAGGVPDHDSQRKKTPFHISRGKSIKFTFHVELKTFTFTIKNKHTYIYRYIHACMNTYIHAYVRTCVRTCMRACVRTYVCTYIW